MAGREKLVIMATHGPEHPELATIPFVMGCAGLASEVDVVIGLQGDAVHLARGGEAERVHAAEFPPLAGLLGDFRELGGRLLVCGPSAKGRGIVPEDLVGDAEVVGAGRFIAEIASATNSLVY